MAIRKIVVQGDDILTKVCRPVTDFNKRLHDLLDDMVETLTEEAKQSVRGAFPRPAFLCGLADLMAQRKN